MTKGFQVPSGGVTLGEVLRNPAEYPDEMTRMQEAIAAAAAKSREVTADYIRTLLNTMAEQAAADRLMNIDVRRFFRTKAEDEIRDFAETFRHLVNERTKELFAAQGRPLPAEIPTPQKTPPPTHDLQARVEQLEVTQRQQAEKIDSLRRELFINAIVLWPDIDDDDSLLDPRRN